MLRVLLLSLAVPSAAVSAEFRDSVAEAVRKGEKRIVIPAGEYRVGPRGGGELWKIEGLRDTEIIADGVLLTGTKLMRAVGFYGCSGVTLRGLTVDYDPLPFTQGEVIAEGEDGNSIDVKIHAGYPRKPYARIDVIDRETRFRKKGMPFLWGTKAEMAAADVVRVRLPGLAKAARKGDLVTLSTGQETGAPHAVCIDNCERMTLCGVTVHSAPGMGILEADGEGGSTFRGCKIVPGPRPAGAAEERLLSSSWDAFQSKTIRKGPLIEGCEISHAGDDSWSMQSSDYVVLKSGGDGIVLAGRDEFTAGLRAGDRIRAGLAGEERRIVAMKVVDRAQAGLAEELRGKLAAAKSWDFWKVGPKCVVAKLDRATGLKEGDSVYSPDRMGQGFVFRDNKVHSPGRILLKAGGLVENNVLVNPHALIACPELPDGAAAGIEDLAILNNTIRGGGWFCAAPWSSQAGVVSLTATAGAKALRAEPVFANVRIEGNVIEGGLGPHLVVSSAKGLGVARNRFVSPQHGKAPDTGASYGIPNDAVVWVANSTGVEFDGNGIEDAGEFAGERPVVLPK